MPADSTPFSADAPGTSGVGVDHERHRRRGAASRRYIDTGAAGTRAPAIDLRRPENAVESPWEQNPYFIPALEAVGITAVGDDASKPYPNPPD